MDRVAIARAERRRQALDELEYERDRAEALEEQIGRLILELEGPGLDDEVFARMAPEDVELVRSTFQGGPALEVEGEEDWSELTGDAEDEEPVDVEQSEREELEAEILRIEGEIAASRRRQEAFERYLEALGG